MAVGPMHRGLERAAGRFGDRPALLAGDRSWSFRDLDAWSAAFARHLARRGVGAGDRVALMMANRVEFLVAVEAVSKLGAAAVMISPAWKQAEVGHAATLTAPVHAVVDADAHGVLGAALGDEVLTDLDDEVLAAAIAADTDTATDTAAGAGPSAGADVAGSAESV
ncbi:MAG TPA: AMP-binding protein, partial [Acidimicrobiales bacterium]|nr:AMP-binding protein [Acidimicrobiales bacterium]